MKDDSLHGFPIVLDIDVAWGDMDSFGHVNNTVYFRYFESARIAFLDAIGISRPDDNDGVSVILASTQCRFRRALTYPDTVRVGARATDVAVDRFTMEYRIISRALGNALAAEGSGVVVAYNYRTLEKTVLPEIVVARIAAL